MANKTARKIYEKLLKRQDIDGWVMNKIKHYLVSLLKLR